jgi:murein DD-endopeptidase MepM/ murein hydrolase activator NlpD
MRACVTCLLSVSFCTSGGVSSGFGARWGMTHYGLDFRGSIGNPIVAAADGVVIEAGPASGFGLWVRIQLDDGTVHVYGHMNSYSVSVGEHVKAGEQIAEIGNRGQSTGPHLHFEVWSAGGKKVDPRSWLQNRGVDV